jgi:hypothetical protein
MKTFLYICNKTDECDQKYCIHSMPHKVQKYSGLPIACCKHPIFCSSIKKMVECIRYEKERK